MSNLHQYDEHEQLHHDITEVLVQATTNDPTICVNLWPEANGKKQQYRAMVAPPK